MTLIEKNLKFLTDKFPHLSTYLNDISVNSQSRVLSAPGGPGTNLEALNLNAKHYVCAGFGNFEFLRFLKSKKSTASVIIFDASSDSFFRALNGFDFSNDFSGLSVVVLSIPFSQDPQQFYPVFDPVVQGGYRAIVETQDRKSRQKTEIALQEILTI